MIKVKNRSMKKWGWLLFIVIVLIAGYLALFNATGGASAKNGTSMVPTPTNNTFSVDKYASAKARGHWGKINWYQGKDGTFHMARTQATENGRRVDYTGGRMAMLYFFLSGGKGRTNNSGNLYGQNY